MPFPIWAYFLVFSFSSALLTFFPIGPLGKTLVLVLGIGVPFLGYLRSSPAQDLRPSFFREEFLGKRTMAGMVLLGVAALLFLFYRLEGLFVWPTGDEGLFAYLGLLFREKPSFDFFYTSSQHSPLLVWLLGLVLPAFNDPFLGLWTIPAILSASLGPLAYFAFRTVCSRSFSLLAALLTALSPCVFYLGHLSSPVSFLLPWELLCFAALGYFLMGAEGSVKFRSGLALGFITGLGFWTYPSWPTVSAAVFLGFLWGNRAEPQRRKLIGVFFLSFFLALAPFLLAVLYFGYGEHILAMSHLNDWRSWGHKLAAVGSSFFVPLWGPWEATGWRWGRWYSLNPLLGAGFLLGLAGILRAKTQGWAQWVLSALTLCLLPGILTADYFPFRNLQAYPLFLAVAVFGWTQLLWGIPREFRAGVLFLMLVLPAGMEARQVLTLHRSVSQDAGGHFFEPKASEDEKAYRLLRAFSEKMGPGCIWTEFTPSQKHLWLYPAVYPFNAAENPRLKREEAQWMGLVTDAGYLPYLKERLKGARWFPIGRGSSHGRDLVVGILPTAGPDRALLEQWGKAHGFFKELNRGIANLSDQRTWDLVWRHLEAGPSRFRGDRFLEASYWEARAEFLYLRNYHLHSEAMIEALRSALQRGYPASHLHFKLAGLLLRKDRSAEARSVLHAGLAEHPLDPDLKRVLALLWEREKGGLNKAVLP